LGWDKTPMKDLVFTKIPQKEKIFKNIFLTENSTFGVTLNNELFYWNSDKILKEILFVHETSNNIYINGISEIVDQKVFIIFINFFYQKKTINL
jgi:hypothetical protein